MPRNSLVNGKTAPDCFNTQLDEVAYPILMALPVGAGRRYRRCGRTSRPPPNYLISHGPSFGPERWEEQGGYSPSTIAAEIAGLVAAGTIARQHGDAADARVWLATADQYQRSIKGWTVTTNGPLSTTHTSSGCPRPATRTPRSATTSATADPPSTSAQVIDAGFLELVRLGELPATDTDVQRTRSGRRRDDPEADAASGPGWLRYNGDGYGDCDARVRQLLHRRRARPGRRPEKAPGTLAGALRRARRAGPRHRASLYRGQAARGDRRHVLRCRPGARAGVGRARRRRPRPSAPTRRSRPSGSSTASPDGSAAPLTWGAGSQVRLTADLTAARVVETPAQTVDRYVRHTQGATQLTVTSPRRSDSCDRTRSTSRAPRRQARRSTLRMWPPTRTARRRTSPLPLVGTARSR